MSDKESKKLMLYIFIGGVIGALYITVFGNYPIMPGFYDALSFGDAPYKYVLLPIPFFPIIFGIGGYLYIQATKEDEK